MAPLPRLGLRHLGEIDLRLAWRVARPGRAQQHSPDAVTHQQHARDQQRPEEQHPMLGVVRQHVTECQEKCGTKDRADQRIG